MKKHIVIPMLLIINLSYSQQVELINENFNSGLPVSWTHNSTNWGSSPIWAVNSGAIKEASGPYFGPVSNWLQLPTVDLTTVTAPFLEFDLAMAVVDTSIQFSVSYTTNNSTWNSLSTYGNLTSGASNIVTVDSASNNNWTPTISDYQRISIDLSQFTNESSIRFRFGSEYMYVYSYGVWYLDSVIVFGNNINVGVLNHSESSLLQLFPNPANSLVRIVPAKHVKNATLKITDFTGSIVLEKLTSLAIEEIDISNYNTGIYLVHYIVSGQKSIVKKLIVH